MPTDTQSEELKGYWDELHSLSIGNPCTCGAIHESNETHKLIQFLSSLNDSYSTVHNSILMMAPIPSVEKAYSILIRDEKQKEVYSDCPVFSPDSVSCSASSSSNSRIHPSSQSTNRSFNQRVNFDSKRNDFVWKYCKKSSHTIDKCFKLHGFPPEFKFTKGKRIATCTQVETPADPTSSLDSSPVDPPPHGFSKEQYDHIMKLFHNVQISTTIQDHPHRLMQILQVGTQFLLVNLLVTLFVMLLLRILALGSWILEPQIT